MLFFHQPFLIFVDSWLTSWGSLEMQTQVPPWLSNGVGGELFFFVCWQYASHLDGQRRNLIGTAWKLHLQWLRDVVSRPGHLRPYETPSTDLIDYWCLLTQWCTPWCSGISLSWSLLPMRELVPSKMIRACIFWLIKGGFHPASHQHPSLSLGKAQS